MSSVITAASLMAADLPMAVAMDDGSIRHVTGAYVSQVITPSAEIPCPPLEAGRSYDEARDMPEIVSLIAEEIWLSGDVDVSDPKANERVMKQASLLASILPWEKVVVLELERPSQELTNA